MRAVSVLLLLLSSTNARADVDLNGTVVSTDRMVVYLFIGHSNMLSNQDGGVIAGAWNYVIPGAWGRAPGWAPAANPLHVNYDAPVAWSGPGKPFLQQMSQQYGPQGYTIGMIQNPNNRATIQCHDHVTPNGIDPAKNRYCKVCTDRPPGDGRTLYHELMDVAVPLKGEVTFGGVVAMLGFIEAFQPACNNNFANEVAELMANIRADLEEPDLPLFIDKGNFWGDHQPAGTDFVTLAQQIENVTSTVPPPVAVIDAGLTLSNYIADDHHYNDTGHTQWAQALVDTIVNNDWFPLAPDVQLSLASTSLHFSVQSGDPDPAAQTMAIGNAGEGVLESVTIGGGLPLWLTVTPSGSGNSQLLTNEVVLFGLSVGQHTATVNVYCANATNSPDSYDVVINIADLLAPTTVDISPATASVTTGGTLPLTASILDQHGAPIVGSITWSADDDDSGFSPATCTASTCATTLVSNAAAGTSVTVTATAAAAQGSAVITIKPRPSITLIQPGGGEMWTAGDIETIEWSSEEIGQLWLQYSLDGGHTLVDIGEHPGGAGSLDWEVPNVSTTDARIVVSSYTRDIIAESGSIIIDGDNPTLSVSRPGETLTAGLPASIEWTAEGVPYVRLEYTIDAGERWHPIDFVRATDANWGQLSWVPPNVASQFCSLRIVVTPSTTAQSQPFAIAPAPAADGDVELHRVELDLRLDATEVWIDDTRHPVNNGSVSAAIAVAAGVDSAVVRLRIGDQERLVRIDQADTGVPIPGLQVSASELRAFLGDQSGVIVWAEQGRLRLLDFRDAEPETRWLTDETDCVNPLLSPDGTRVLYSRGPAGGAKTIWARALDGAAQQIGAGDVGYWNKRGEEEAVIIADWSPGPDNGKPGTTFRQRVSSGGVTPIGSPVTIHDRAMDAGPNGDALWLGQVYKQVVAARNDAGTWVEYLGDDFDLLDGPLPADHQTCNGSMAPDGTGRLMTLVIPHDWIRIFTFDAVSDRFFESSRFELPPGATEWEFPEWSTHPDYFTAVMRFGGMSFSLFLVKVGTGTMVPEVLQLTGDDTSVSYSHLFIQ